MYLPYLNLAPAEMLALESLPEGDKDALRPIFSLRRWLSSAQLSKSFGRIEKAFGRRPAFLIAPEFKPDAEAESVAAELNTLLVADGGYAAWCDLFEREESGHFIPSTQLTDASQFDAQARRLIALGRGLMVPLTRSAVPFLDPITTRSAAQSGGGEEVTFLLDLGRQSKTLLVQEAELYQIGQRILERCPQAKLAFSCSSFPSSFGEMEGQEIYERTLYQNLRRRLGSALQYSDRGSARVDKGGGGGVPYPRIDYPRSGDWRFYRTENPEPYETGYIGLAERLMAQPTIWDPKLRIWGTQMIEKTRLGDKTGISSPARSTAVRINLHLHRQLWFDEPGKLYDTDDDWTDEI